MSDDNHYRAPEAEVDTRSGERYQPRIFAWNGRIGRLRYLAYATGLNLVLAVIMIPLAAGAGFMQASNGGDPQGVGVATTLVTILFYVIATVLGVVFGKRRLNDLDRSGWWLLLAFVPFLNIIFMIYVLFFAGTKGPNRFGPPPVPNTAGVVVLGILMPIVFVVGILAAIAIPAYQGYVQRAEQAAMENMR